VLGVCVHVCVPLTFAYYFLLNFRYPGRVISVGGGGSLFLELDLPTGLCCFLYLALLLSRWVSFAVDIGLFCFPYTSLSLSTQLSFTFYIHFFCGSLRKY